MTYKRFLDLQKAEAQAREAQIEAALERVRSRSMAMHKSEELADVITVISEQLRLLNIRFDNVSFARNDGSDGADFWISVYGRTKPYRVKVPLIDNPNLTRITEARGKGMMFYQDILHSGGEQSMDCPCVGLQSTGSKG